MTLWVPGSSPGHAFTGVIAQLGRATDVSPPIVAAGLVTKTFSKAGVALAKRAAKD
jgi:hypothetical protein